MNHLQLGFLIVCAIIFLIRNRFDSFFLAYFAAVIYFLPSVVHQYQLPDGFGDFVPIRVQLKSLILADLLLGLIVLWAFLYDYCLKRFSALSNFRLNLLDRVSLKRSAHVLVVIVFVFLFFSIRKTGMSFLCLEKIDVMAALTAEYSYCMSAVVLLSLISFQQRMWGYFLICTVILLFDLMAGFRVHFVIAFISVLFSYVRNITFKDYLYILKASVAAVLMGVFVVLVKGWLWQIKYIVSASTEVRCPSDLAGDVRLLSPGAAAEKLLKGMTDSSVAMQSALSAEPVVTFAIFNQVIQEEYRRNSGEYSSQFVYAVPGYSTLSGNAYPQSKAFGEILRESLLPGINYQIGSNFWAQFYTYYGVSGVVVGFLLFLSALVFVNLIIFNHSGFLSSLGIVVCVWVGFYVHRNELSSMISILKVFLHVCLLVLFILMGSGVIVALLSKRNKSI